MLEKTSLLATLRWPLWPRSAKKKFRISSIITGESMFWSKIPETLNSGCLSNGMRPPKTSKRGFRAIHIIVPNRKR